MGINFAAISKLSSKIRINQIAGKFDNFLKPPDDKSDGIFSTVSDAFNFLQGKPAPDTRKIGTDLVFNDKAESSGLINRIFNMAGNAMGFLVSGLKWLTFSAVDCLGWLLAGWRALVNFDWNMTDQQINAGLHSASLNLAALWGGAFGEVFGTMTAIGIGYGISVAIPVIGPGVAKAIVWEVFQEQWPELFSSIKNALVESTKYCLYWAAAKSYIALRNILKKAFPQTFANWGSGERWTLSEWWENKVESISNEHLQVFTEEFFEEGFEKFIEVGFIFARKMDDHIAAAKTTKQVITGNTILTRLDLDPETNERFFYPQQPAESLKKQILSDITTFRQVRNRDIGYFTGEPIEEESRRFNFLRTGKVVFRGLQKPPYADSKKSTLTLKDLKIGLKWKDFKEALKPYTWGNHYVYVTLNRSRQEIGAWFFNPQEGEVYLKKLVELLIDDEWIAIDSYTEIERNRYIKKTDDMTLMYPSHITITIKTPISSRDDATHDLAGNSYKKDLRKIPLWTETEPTFDFDVNGGFLT